MMLKLHTVLSRSVSYDTIPFLFKNLCGQPFLLVGGRVWVKIYVNLKLLVVELRSVCS
jgi:hypothetical protein